MLFTVVYCYLPGDCENIEEGGFFVISLVWWLVVGVIYSELAGDVGSR